MGDNNHLALSPRWISPNSFTGLTVYRNPRRKEVRFQVLGRILDLVELLYENAWEWIWLILTRKGQLERVLTSSTRFKATQMIRLEDCLRRRLGVELRKTLQPEADSELILQEQYVTAEGEERAELKRRLNEAILHFDAYDILCEQVEVLREEKYDRTREDHELKLAKLWDLMCPDEPLDDRIGKHWREIGFQGDDPATDFRGMGILSLDQMIYLSREENEDMKALLSLSHHPRIGFPFAIAGITITSLTRHLLKAGRLKKHFYNTSSGPCDLDGFHQAYCRIFVLFGQFWKRSDPLSVMSFNPVRLEFEKKLAETLNEDCANLHELSLDDL